MYYNSFMDTKTKIFRVVAGFVGIYHIVLGAVATFGGSSLVGLVAKLYNISPTLDSQFLYLAKFIAAYGIAFGVMMAMVAYNPQKYYMLAWGAIVLFAVRIFDRLFYFDLLKEAFDPTMGQNLITVFTIGILGLALFIYMPKKSGTV